MSPKRIKQYFADYDKALGRLKSALEEDVSISDTIIDGVIQRFEFTYELAWKLAKSFLNYNGIEANNPRSVIKEAFSEGMIANGQGWIDMLEDRNKTSHVYDEAAALKIYDKIKKMHYQLLKDFHSKIKALTDGL